MLYSQFQLRLNAFACACAKVEMAGLSAEPGRKAPYSIDLRWRVVWQRAGMQLPFRAIARGLNIAVGTVYNIWKRFVDTGDITPRKVDFVDRRYLSERDELIILGILHEDCTSYLSEICQQVLDIISVSVSPSTVCRIIHRNGLTRKKVQQVALQQSSEYRSAFMSQVLLFRPEMFVWVDETGCDRRDNIRRYGYALCGERPVYHRFFERGNRISAICALTMEGVLCVDLKIGTVDGSKFFDFICGKLIPEMQPFDGQNEHSILILDNCAIHHIQEVKEILISTGILVFFLPPYSPDLNPVEELFSYYEYS